MNRLLRAGILITFGMLIIGIIGGCGDDSPEVVTDPSNPTTSRGTPPRTDVGPPHEILGAVDPAPGQEIAPNTQFSLIFDQAVVAVTVNGTAATGAGLNWTASLTLQEGDGQTLDIRWTNRDGSSGSRAMGPYTVRVPDTTPPRITGGTVADGTVDVDPASINAGGIQFDFSEDITGTVKLTDEAGADLNWIATVGGQTAILTPVAGQELANNTVYKIEIDVQDGGGNRFRATITFVTKPK
jgi:hypothetical protein